MRRALMHKALVSLLAFFWTSSVFTQDEDHSHHQKAHSPGDAPIQIAINPEARVSVTRGGALPPAGPCGKELELPVRIINQGFLTATLRATLIEPVPEHVRLAFSAERLKGVVEEHRILYVALQQPGLVDITVAFRPKGDVGDLGGRDRIQLLVRCE